MAKEKTIMDILEENSKRVEVSPQVQQPQEQPKQVNDQSTSVKHSESKGTANLPTLADVFAKKDNDPATKVLRWVIGAIAIAFGVMIFISIMKNVL
jgi:ferritin